MDNKERKNKPLSDGEMDAVVGGAEQTYRKVQVWGTLCERYKCRYCGSESRYYTDHKSKRCPVPGYGNPNYDPNDIVTIISGEADNGCWSCTHARYGGQTPYDSDDVWCTYKK